MPASTIAGEAIAAATILAARHLGVADSLGTIAPGKWADIIAVGGDPLVTIESTADIYLVIADGQVLYDSGTLSGFRDPIPVQVALQGVRDLCLVVLDGGDGKNNDHADWGDVRLRR